METASLQVVGRRKRSHEIYEILEKAIASGEYPTGEQLPAEKVLADRFKVGRPSVREALFLLQQQGLVEITSGARARVTNPTSSRIVDQLSSHVRRFTSTDEGQKQMEQVRLVLEAGVAWQAAQMATDEDILRLKQALDANVAAVGNNDEFVRTDVAFHNQLNLITGNPVFSAVHEVVFEWLTAQRTYTINVPDADRLSVRDHTAIYEAVAAHDPMRAFHEMGSHLRLVGRLHDEAKRLSRQILRDMARDVAERMDREKEDIWSAVGTPPARR